MHTFGESAGSIIRKQFQPRMTFRNAIGATLDLLGSTAFAAEFDLKAWVGNERPGDDLEIAPVIDVTIIDTYLQASISIDDSYFKFLHPSLITAEPLLQDAVAAGRRKDRVAKSQIAEAALAASPYLNPIRSVRTVEVHPLLPAAELLNGRSFVSLLNERFDREAAHA
jgi:hypothetical protein